jgi:leucyl aminopeptidase
MNIQVRVGEVVRDKDDLIALGFFEDRKELDPIAEDINQALNGQIQQILLNGDFKGQERETTLLYTLGMIPSQRVLMVGLGKREKFGLEAIRIASASVARKVCEIRVRSFASIILGAEAGRVPLADAAQAMVEGIVLALYESNELKTKPEGEPRQVDHLTLVVPNANQKIEIEKAAGIGHEIAKSVNIARALVNLPANYVTPTVLGNRASEVATQFGMRCQLLEEAEMAELGMNSLLGVAQGSAEPAKLIVLEYNGDCDDLDTLVLVGKGITFDSGGISLKQAENMHVCKGDMAGAAAVLGAMRAAAALHVPLHIVGLIPATENMPGGRAYKPGDVVVAMNGKSIEVISTDAEGRMILADALVYAGRYRPQAIIDLATLTGSVMIALGQQAIGLFSNDDDLAARIESAGMTSYERVWRLPLFEEYGRQLKSQVADFKNAGGQAGGAITAAMFLQEFVDGVPWAHLDIAGRGFAWSEEDKPFTPYLQGWATGIGVRLLTQFLRDWVANRPGAGSDSGVMEHSRG